MSLPYDGKLSSTAVSVHDRCAATISDIVSQLDRERRSLESNSGQNAGIQGRFCARKVIDTGSVVDTKSSHRLDQLLD